MPLILLLARTDAKKAETEMEEARRKLPKDLIPLTLAPCYEALGKVEQAEEQYSAALKAAPDSPMVLRQVASFYSRAGQPDKVEPILRRLLDPRTQAPEATVAWAGRPSRGSLGSWP